MFRKLFHFTNYLNYFRLAIVSCFDLVHIMPAFNARIASVASDTMISRVLLGYHIPVGSSCYTTVKMLCIYTEYENQACDIPSALSLYLSSFGFVDVDVEPTL